MSLYLAPEVAAAVVPPIVVRALAPRPDTRPVESSARPNAGASDQKQSRPDAASLDKPQPGDRPPGVDPSQPPQSQFEASLISADYKPSTRPAADLQSETGPAVLTAQPDKAAPEESATKGAGDTEINSNAEDLSAPAPVSAPGTDVLADAAKFAAYTHGAGGTKLPLPSTANPDFLTSVEKIA